MVSHSSRHVTLSSESSAELSPEGGVGLLERVEPETPWKVIVWNDPVNLMSYVTYVFRAHFGFSESKARTLMMAVHQEGKAIVFTGGREEAERHTSALHGYGLWATFEKDSGE
ncbi:MULTISPECIES: ATP-dependent Clp protease adapter ClpS [Kocuria]|uniref:ATP-dependent Clp protease adapter ClpS n=1 Tax=Kocuria TaxID=57493 RepID=UPI000660375C|nr:MULTISPECIES: ATP-dependent Clp protease adapter ClpS [Kocuria]MCT1368241.1 ATP-dependent Clp protease adapter ClpS [Rothia sp. p3-SID1597]RUQ22405.1 ATP-dependent Clp protease adapter ClpS [Kocuria sp. HSID16901]